jgi:hypothetical protein
MTNVVLCIVTLVMVTSAIPSEERGFVSLFDGKTLQGWVYVGGEKNGYLMKKEMLICPAEENGNLFTKKEYSNFILRFEFCMEEGANNGVGIRAPLRNDVHLTGIEIQILDDQAARYRGVLKPAQYHGSVYGAVPARPGFLRKPGEWNEQEITANERRIKVVLNGTTILDADLNSVRDPQILEAHPGLQRSWGHIGFLGHGSKVAFRNIRIKELP